MALAIASMIRRASSTALTLAIRESTKTPKSFRTAAASSVQTLAQDTARGSFLPLSRFSTSAAVASENGDEELVRELKTEINRAEEPRDWEFPGGFPFEINGNLLTRKFEDEMIKIELDLSDVEEKEEEQSSDSDSDELYDSIIPMVVTISKGNGQELTFDITACRDDSIYIDSITNTSTGEEKLEGPKFSEEDMELDLKRAYHRYLEIRGIKPSFRRAYLYYKKNRERLNWLNSLNKFLDK